MKNSTKGLLILAGAVLVGVVFADKIRQAPVIGPKIPTI